MIGLPINWLHVSSQQQFLETVRLRTTFAACLQVSTMAPRTQARSVSQVVRVRHCLKVKNKGGKAFDGTG